MKDYEIEFYARLGLLSVKFAQMEYKLSTILGKLFGSDDDLITVTVTEKNTLTKNIELLKSLNRIRKFQYALILDLINKISKIQSDRNLFIHGIWGNPIISENSVIIICDEKKIRYNEEKDKVGNIIDQTWHFNKNHILSLTDIENRINDIDNIISLEDSLIKDLENERFN
jgi:hypothetical protein